MPNAKTEKFIQTKLQKKLQAEKAEFKRKQAELENCRDLRDDVMSAVKNSGMSYEVIHSRFGPHPSTLTNWAEKKVDMPRMGKLRATLRAIGMDLMIGVR